MLTCKQNSLLVSQSFDRELSWRERLGVHMHLLMCRGCARFKQQMDFLRKAVHRFTRAQAEAEERTRLSAAAIERIARHVERYR